LAAGFFFFFGLLRGNFSKSSISVFSIDLSVFSFSSSGSGGAAILLIPVLVIAAVVLSVILVSASYYGK